MCLDCRLRACDELHETCMCHCHDDEPLDDSLREYYEDKEKGRIADND